MRSYNCENKMGLPNQGVGTMRRFAALATGVAITLATSLEAKEIGYI